LEAGDCCSANFILNKSTMIRATTVVVLSLLTNFSEASRIAIEHAAGRTAIEHEDRFPLGRSCEELKGIFRRRVTAVQESYDTNHNATHISTMSQARISMRVFGVVRTFRRAKDCQWVIDGGDEEVELARSVLQAALAEHPCAQAALAEMTPEAFETAGNNFQPLQRAMIVMVSESCEVPELEVESVAVVEDQAEVELDLDEKEELLQEQIDGLFEQAADESEAVAAGSFVQVASKFSAGYVVRVIGAVFFGLLMALACAPFAMIAGAIIGFLICVLSAELSGGSGFCISPGVGSMELNSFVFGGAVGGMAGFGTCAYGLVNSLLPSTPSNA